MVISDHRNLAYLLHFLLGSGNLVPWNSFITAADYFSHLYPHGHVDKTFAVAYMGCYVLVSLSLSAMSHWDKKASVGLRIYSGLVLFVLSLLVPPLLDWTGGVHLGGAYGLTVVAVVVTGIADGLVMVSLIGSTGELPDRYMQAYFMGTAVSGVIVCVLRIITKASYPQNPGGLRASSHIYFITSILIILGCIIIYNALERLPIVKYYRSVKPQISKQDTSTEISNIISTSESEAKPKFWMVWKKIKWITLALVAIYIVTLSIFPGYITENVHSKRLKDWFPILLITAYNVFDLAGKALTAIYLPKGIKKPIWACFVRLILYPIFAACLHGPRVLRSEAPIIILTCILGLTNGYLTSVLMMFAPKSVPQHESETAGSVMATFLGFGLAGGSVLGWVWVL